MVEVGSDAKATNNVPEMNPVSNIQRQLMDAFLIFLEILFLLLKVLYAIGESIYKTLLPAGPKSVKGEIVLVTGAGHGMGRELALLYASQGATVVGWDINTKNNEDTIRQINQSGYPKAYAYYCNVSNRDNVLEVAKQVQSDVGDVTILINNAGIMPTRPFLHQSTEDIIRVFDINVLAHFWTLQAFLPAMRKKNHGHIVALSSCAGLAGFENLVPYCGSKFAVRGIMEAVQEEMRLEGLKIETTTICPYMVDTGLCKKPVIRFKNSMPMLKPEAVAKAIMNAQRTNRRLVTVPGHMLAVHDVIRLLPWRARIEIKNFLRSGVDPED